MVKKSTLAFIVILIVIIILVNFLILGFLKNKNTNLNNNKSNNEEVYNVEINPSDFSNVIDNKYLTFTPRTNFIYEGKTKKGTEHIEVYVTEETKEIIGVKTLVVWDRVWLDGSLTEDTKDWYAQDKEGNVWYFGEDSKEIVLGEVVSTHGSWETGVDGAKPGIVMKANPKVGEIYYQEYYKDNAEDKAEVVSLEETRSVPFGTFNNCLKTREWSPLETNSDEYKYYCENVRNIILETNSEDKEPSELIKIEKNVEPRSADKIVANTNKKEITEEEAKQIALERVPGEVTDFGIELKFGKKTYVVEIDADNGPETDVIIDPETGEILAVET